MPKGDMVDQDTIYPVVKEVAVDAVCGEVIITTLSDAISMTPPAARDTARRLVAAADEADRQ